jgi:hypothetical protein
MAAEPSQVKAHITQLSRKVRAPSLHKLTKFVLTSATICSRALTPMNTTATRPFRVRLRLPTMPSSVIRWYPSTRQKMDNSYACTLSLAAQQRLRRRLFSLHILNLNTERKRFLAHLRRAAIAQKRSPPERAWPCISTPNIDRFGNPVLRQKRRAAKLPSPM